MRDPVLERQGWFLRSEGRFQRRPSQSQRPQRQQGDSFAERQLRSATHVRKTVSPFLYRIAHLRLSILRLYIRPRWSPDITRV